MDFLSPYVQQIEKNLSELSLPKSPATLYDPQRYLLETGGKRIRPVLTLIACGLCKGDTQNAIPAAIAVELLHNFTLMHDDIMDQAESRRGRASVHLKWNTSTAILSGDSMYTQALLQVHKIPEDVDYKKVALVFLEGINRVCEGQALDMEFEERESVSIDEYLEMISGKTSALLSAGMQMGGIIAGSESSGIEKLAKLGDTLGLAFQIQDDWLDIVADPDKFGKKTAGDVFEGKKTYLMISLLNSCNKEEKKWLLNCLKNKPLAKPDVDKVIELYKKYDILESAAALKDSYYSEAENILNTFEESGYKQDLKQLIETLKAREY